MDIIFVFLRDIIVDDAVHIVHIDAPGGNIRGNQDGQLSIPEPLHGLFPLTLADIAVDAVAVQSHTLEIVTQSLAHMLGVAENHHPFKALGLNQPVGALCLFQGCAAQAELVDVRPILLLCLHSDLHLVALVHPGHRHHLLRDGGREQSQIFPVFGLLNDSGDILEKAHVQHPVGFIQHHRLHLVQMDGLPVVMIHQTTRCCHHNLGLALQLLDLSADAGAAVEHRHPDSLIKGQQTPKLVPNLDGQLPGGSQNQPLNTVAFRVDMLNHGNAEGKGLTGASGCLGNYILPLQKMRNGLRLNGGGVSVSLFFQSLQHGIAEAQLCKCYFCHNDLSFFCVFPIKSQDTVYQTKPLFATIFPSCTGFVQRMFSENSLSTPRTSVDKCREIWYIVFYDIMSAV